MKCLWSMCIERLTHSFKKIKTLNTWGEKTTGVRLNKENKVQNQACKYNIYKNNK